MRAEKRGAVECLEGKAISDSDARLRVIFDTASDAIIGLDEQGTVKSFNQAAEKLFGYPALEIIGRNVSVIIPPERAPHFARSLGTGKGNPIGATRETAGCRRDGSAFPIDLSIGEVRIDAQRIFTCIVRDISEWKKAQQALRMERDFTSAVLATSKAMIIVLDEWGRVVRFNRACERVSGFAAKEVVGIPFWDCLLVPEEAPDVKSGFRQLLTGYIPDRMENFWVTKTGQRRLINWSAALMTPGDGTGKFIIGTGLDVTDRRRLESEVLQISEKERHRISHELHDGLCQQLVGIQFAIELIAKKMPPNKVVKSQLAKVAKEMQAAIRQSRAIAHGLTPMHLEIGGLIAALDELATTTESVFKIQCRFVCTKAVPIADSTTATQLYYIAREAVQNAVKHGCASRITIALRTLKLQGKLTIVNDGAPFSGVADHSSGMGLHIMQYRTEMFGGRFTIEPGQPNGTVVTCTWKP